MPLYSRTDGTLVLSTENSVYTDRTDTAISMFNQWCSEMGTAITSNTDGFNGDDSCFCITSQCELSYGGLTFVPRLFYATEAGFGLYDAIPTNTSSTSAPPPNTSRFHVTTSRPALLITYHLAGVDMGAFNTQYKLYSDGFCLYAMHGHYGGSNTFYVALKVNTSGIYMYFEKGTTTSTIPLYLNVWNPSSSTWTQSTITTLLSGTSHTYVTLENSSYVSSGEVIFGPYDIQEDCKLNTVETIPTDTSIVYSYSTDNTNWVTVTTDDTIPSSSSLYIRAVLSTSNNRVTPTLSALWLSKTTTDKRIILLKTGLQSRFNNVEGDITVTYDSAKGRLRGRGGPVESFTTTFTPTGLERKPNPSEFEKITLVPSVTGPTITKVTYKKGYSSEKITITPACTLVLTYVGIVNP